MKISENELRSKILGCWFGKNVGGTLGAPFEWRRQINDVTFYTHNIDGDPLPNDDLDIQLLWLIAMEQNGVGLSPSQLGHYWEVCVTPHWAEYGIAKANMKLGLIPPLSGDYNNCYKHSCGSYIRSEIWACIAPGTPALAAQFMLKDSQIDHGGKSEGTYAAVFIAALESAAFIEKDIKKLINIALTYIPDDCFVAEAVRAVIEFYESGKSYIQTRDMLLEKYRGEPFTYCDNGVPVKLVSERDRKLGFDNGRKGFDVVDNLGIIIIGLLYGKGDFADSMLYAINCGEDTDCTAATIGSIFGILVGYEGLPEKWTKPIGSKIKTCCLDYGALEGRIPTDVVELTERTLKLYRQTELRYPLNIHIMDESEIESIDLTCNRYVRDNLYRFADCAYHTLPFFDVAVRYDDGVEIKNGESVGVTLYLINRYDTCEYIEIEWLSMSGLSVDNCKATVFLPQDRYGDHIQSVHFTVTASDMPATSSAVVYLRMAGRVVSQAITIPFVRASGQSPLVVR